MDECIQRILGDVDGAIDWVIQGKDEHPNRLDIIRESSNRGRANRGRGGRNDFASRVEQPAPNAFSSTGAAPFGQQNQGAFGEPARQGSPFAQPGFGQAPFSQTSTLVQNSPFNSPAQPAFGQTPFGQQPAQTASFGQFNGNGFAQQQNQFDQTMLQDQPMATDSFGQPQQASNAFGQPIQNAANPFGQAQAQASSNGGFNMAAQQQGAINGGQMMVEDPPAAMFGLNEQQFKEAYEQAKQSGGFQDGAVPMFAPKSEWRS
jgi:nucleoporin NUP42